jgi:hypothetical protein
MKFTLTYEGPLPASGNDAVGPHKSDPKLPLKWRIRQQIAPQLTQLYKEDPHLNGSWGVPSRAAAKEIREPIKRGNFNFVAIVRSSLDLVCSLKIKVQVNHESGSVMQKSGDLDNRIKTLFDALRVPKEQECRAEKSLDDPFPCLLEDDALITDLQVSMNRWLGAAGKQENEARVDIDVIVRTSRPNLYTEVFGIE